MWLIRRMVGKGWDFIAVFFAWAGVGGGRPHGWVGLDFGYIVMVSVTGSGRRNGVGDGRGCWRWCAEDRGPSDSISDSTVCEEGAGSEDGEEEEYGLTETTYGRCKPPI